MDDESNSNSLDQAIEELEDLCRSDELSLDSLQELVGKLPQELFTSITSTLSDSYFLQGACFNKRVTPEILEYLFQHFPGVASVSTDETAWLNGGDYPAYPIHLACSNEHADCPDFVISALIQEAPLALRQLAIIEDGLNNLGPDYEETGLGRANVAGTPLHYYLERESNINLALVKELITAYPQALSSYQEALEYQPKGVTPIYVLLSNPNIGELQDVLQYIVEINPSQMRMTDGVSDYAPIHIAIQNKGVNASIVQLLLDAWPESIQTKSMDWFMQQPSKLPIHTLCCTNEDLDDAVAQEILELLLLSDTSSARVQDAQGFLPIHYAVMDRCTNFCKVLVTAYPESLMVATSFIADYESLPIHLACYQGGRQSAETVQYLIDQCPESLRFHDKHGDTPLHKAAKKNTQIIKSILAHDPSLASIKSTGEAVFGRDLLHLPLHGACGYLGTIENVQLLFDAYPDGIFDVTSPTHQFFTGEPIPGKTPLEIARNNRSGDITVVDFLETQHEYAKMAENHAAMTTRDDNGRLPLHTALLEEATHGAITFLLRGNTAALQVADNNGMLPIHFVCRYGSVDTVKLLAESYDGGLELVDGNNNYPLHHACLGSNYEAVQYLLERGKVSERNGDGKLPLHLLCEAEEDNEADSESTSYVETMMMLLLACPETVSGFFTLPPNETWLRSGRRWKRGRIS